MHQPYSKIPLLVAGPLGNANGTGHTHDNPVGETVDVLSYDLDEPDYNVVEISPTPK